MAATLFPRDINTLHKGGAAAADDDDDERNYSVK
jgi:hypothetical protein